MQFSQRFSPILGAVLLLWLQLWWSLVPSWRFGEYYEYGWMVPPIALWFALRRWNSFPGPKAKAKNKDKNKAAAAPESESPPARLPAWLGWSVIVIVFLLFPALRIVELADPGWRVPLLLQAVVVVTLSHALIGWTAGARFSWYLAPVTLFALTAVPWPGQVERGLIQTLTHTVITFTSELFLLNGKPVEVSGDRLTLGTQVVEVTEGCSGIRSLQSLVMAALFFGEMLLLTWPRRFVLLLVAAACTLVVNTARAWALAEIQFTKGKEAANAAHDWIGHVAFVLSAALLFGSAWLLQRERRARIVIRQVTPGTGHPSMGVQPRETIPPVESPP